MEVPGLQVTPATCPKVDSRSDEIRTCFMTRARLALKRTVMSIKGWYQSYGTRFQVNILSAHWPNPQVKISFETSGGHRLSSQRSRHLGDELTGLVSKKALREQAMWRIVLELLDSFSPPVWGAGWKLLLQWGVCEDSRLRKKTCQYRPS